MTTHPDPEPQVAASEPPPVLPEAPAGAAKMDAQGEPPLAGATPVGQPPAPVIPSPESTEKSTLWIGTLNFGHKVRKHWWGVLLVVLVSLLMIAGSVYLSWWVALPTVLEWANAASWRWILAWMAVMTLAFVPFYVIFGFGAVMAASLGLLDDPGKIEEKRALDEIDQVESDIRGSADPVDYARYGRKSLRLYYHMGQNQVRVSFYIGVIAMVFGFMFLLAGLLLQALDTSQPQFWYLRDNPDIALVTVGGGAIIEFVAATFLWTYKTTILQQTLYYRRQMLVHSALISVAIASKMQAEGGAALRRIVDAMISPDWENQFPDLPKVGARAGVKGKAGPTASGSKTRGDGRKTNGREAPAVRQGVAQG